MTILAIDFGGTQVKSALVSEQFAIGVDDLEATHQAHKEAGYTVTDLSGLPGKPKMYYFITDPDGYKIEVIRLTQFLEK